MFWFSIINIEEVILFCHLIWSSFPECILHFEQFAWLQTGMWVGQIWKIFTFQIINDANHDAITTTQNGANHKLKTAQTTKSRRQLKTTTQNHDSKRRKPQPRKKPRHKPRQKPRHTHDKNPLTSTTHRYHVKTISLFITKNETNLSRLTVRQTLVFM